MRTRPCWACALILQGDVGPAHVACGMGPLVSPLSPCPAHLLIQVGAEKLEEEQGFEDSRGPPAGWGGQLFPAVACRDTRTWGCPTASGVVPGSHSLLQGGVTGPGGGPRAAP